MKNTVARIGNQFYKKAHDRKSKNRMTCQPMAFLELFKSKLQDWQLSLASGQVIRQPKNRQPDSTNSRKIWKTLGEADNKIKQFSSRWRI